MKIINDNILNVESSVIFQSVNCQGIMGGGLALAIRKEWPEVYSNYLYFISEFKKKNIKVYNTFHSSFLLGEVNWTMVDNNNIVVNLFAQDNIGTHQRQTCYKSLLNCLTYFQFQKEVLSYFKDKNLCFPYAMGAGLGGGDWNIIEKIIVTKFPDCLIYKKD